MALSKDIIVYGTVWCPDCIRSRGLLEARGIHYRWVDIEQDPEGRRIVEQVNGGKRRVPTIVFPDGRILVEPSNAQLAAELSVNAAGA